MLFQKNKTLSFAGLIHVNGVPIRLKLIDTAGQVKIKLFFVIFESFTFYE